MEKRRGLTAKQVEHMKAPDGRLEVPAGPPPGLYLVVQPSGHKSWSLRYRFGGRSRKMTLKDPYPELTLAQARAEAEAALKKLESGIDPAAKLEPVRDTPDTVGNAISEFIERYASKRNRSWKETERILTRELAEWSSLPLRDIGRADVLRRLDEVVDRGTPIAANRALAALRRFFGWCVERGMLETSPAAGIRAPSPERSRDRVLTDTELVEIWRAVDLLGFPNREFFRLLILTGQRRGEVAALRWDHLDFEATPVWRLPKETVKSGREHFVPLAPVVVELLQGLPRFSGPYVLTTSDGQAPISGFSQARKRLDGLILAAGRKNDSKAEPMADWRLHDIRRTFATGLAGLGVPPHVLAAILNHSPGRTQGITAVYNRHRYAAERRQALEGWAEHVLELVRRRESREKRTVA
jgi:integrase